MADVTNNNIIASLIYPLFVKKGTGIKEEINSMPGIHRFSVDTLMDEVGYVNSRGIDKVLLFAVPGTKDERATEAFADDAIVPAAVRALKKRFPGIVVMTDICLCAYTSHGHCGILERHKTQDTRHKTECEAANNVTIDNERTLEALGRMAVLHAASGADYVAPSAMAKDEVRVIREALDNNGYGRTRIMGYSAKFASQFYGPFRDAADSAPRFGDRRGYQLDYADRKAALREIEDDIQEGADIVMVKPALGYLDVIRDAKDRFGHTLAAYNVSGEYSMVKAGSGLGYWDERKMVFEIIASIKRAGADLIITYHARDIVSWIGECGYNEKELVAK